MASSSDQRSSDQRAQAADETFHPIIEIMRTNLRNGTVVADVIRNDGDSSAAFTVFTGFANFVDLAASACAFQSLSSNRAINAEVVAARVASNEEHYERHGRYCEFGQINLLIMLPDPRPSERLCQLDLFAAISAWTSRTYVAFMSWFSRSSCPPAVRLSSPMM